MPFAQRKYLVFDTELIGKKTPKFLVRMIDIEEGVLYKFWHHKRGHTAKLEKMLADPQYTWVGFNSENFDRPLISAAIMGHDEENLKIIATHIIEDGMRSWQTYREFQLDFIEYDHIDLIETAPGVMISLKTYMGRMGYPTLQDMPFHHDHDLAPQDEPVVEKYCINDCGGTAELFKRLKVELDLRVELGERYDLELRSKSDAQVAEAILKKQMGINVKRDTYVPLSVSYTAPDFIKTKNPVLQELIEHTEGHAFPINRANGSPIEADWMEEPIQIGNGIYKYGLGGLHSQHDKNFYAEASDELMISDFDVGSYYPSIMLKCGMVPNFGGNRGELFLEEYRKIYEERLAAKAAGNKRVANSLKICLNGTFGKLGSIYSAFYSPDLLIAVTITGQLNLLCLIDELTRLKGVVVYSANTDGLMVGYPPGKRDKVLKVFAANAKRTGFEYEETPYRKVAMKDVNNYFAIGVDGKVKKKGIYATNDPTDNALYLMKNPTMDVCSFAVAEHLVSGKPVHEYIYECADMTKFVEIRNVKGGGIQHKEMVEVDDWVGEPRNWRRPHWPGTKKSETRVSRPKPVWEGRGGTPFGRVARWYMTTQDIPPISYVSSGNKVAGTDGAKLCMELPAKPPKDLNYQWYVDEAHRILKDVGVPEFQCSKL